MIVLVIPFALPEGETIAVLALGFYGEVELLPTFNRVYPAGSVDRGLGELDWVDLGCVPIESGRLLLYHSDREMWTTSHILRWGSARIGPEPRRPSARLPTPPLLLRATAARHHFQTLDFLAHSFVEGGVGKEDQ